MTSLIVVLFPGTGVIYTVSTGLFSGRKSSVAAASGCTMGIIPHLLASIFSLSAILHMSAVAFQVVKMAGVAYLFYLAWSMWRDSGGLAFNSPQRKSNPLKIAIRGLLINILNPKLSIFFLAFLPLFVSPHAASPMLQLFSLSAVFMAMTLVIFIAYGISAGSIRNYVVNSPKLMTWLQRSCAAAFAGLGAKLALTDQGA